MDEKAEKYREFLTNQIGNDTWYTVIVPHRKYTIRSMGKVVYMGNNIWRIGDVTFPLDSIREIDKKQIHLEE